MDEHATPRDVSEAIPTGLKAVRLGPSRWACEIFTALGVSLAYSGVELDLDESAVWNQPSDVVRSVRWLDAGEGLGVSAGGVAPVAVGRKQQTRPDHVTACCAELGRSVERALDGGLRLAIRVSHVLHTAVVERRRAADRNVGAGAHCAGVAG